MDIFNLGDGPIKSEFSENPDCYVIFATNGLEMGRMIAASKSEYCKEHQGELVIFNANIITESYGKIWYGDLNINLDFDNLKNIADQLNEDLYILVEGEARFGYENRPVEILMSKARVVIKCNKIKHPDENEKHEEKIDLKLPKPKVKSKRKKTNE